MITLQKQLGQYITPKKIVVMILDSIDYSGETVFKKRIMEPSFGNGAFLEEIIRRIAEEGLNAGMSPGQMKNVIERNVFGMEIDSPLYFQAIKRLDDMLLKYGISGMDWSQNLILTDALSGYKDFEKKMDLVIGNPPYVNIHNLSDKVRGKLRHLGFSGGMSDLYIVFFKIGILMLGRKGRLAYISPNSFMKNSLQARFRNYLIRNKYLDSIYDFGSFKVFEDADTYACICILNKDRERRNKSLCYRKYDADNILEETIVSYDCLEKHYVNAIWSFGLKEQDKCGGIRIKDIAIVQNGISTNKDSVYIISAFYDEELITPFLERTMDTSTSYVYFKTREGEIRKIETKILRRCVKGSKYTGTPDNTYIIFPYLYEVVPGTGESCALMESHTVSPMDEDYLKNKYPLAYSYLLHNNEILTKRDMDKRSSWFLFARSQGLLNSFQKKIVFKHVINKNDGSIIPYILEEDIIVYSGMYTTISPAARLYKNELFPEADDKISVSEFNDMVLSKVKEIFSEKRFRDYCCLMSKDMSGSYVSVSTVLPVSHKSSLISCPSR